MLRCSLLLWCQTHQPFPSGTNTAGLGTDTAGCGWLPRVRYKISVRNCERWGIVKWGSKLLFFLHFPLSFRWVQCLTPCFSHRWGFRWDYWNKQLPYQRLTLQLSSDLSREYRQGQLLEELTAVIYSYMNFYV